MASHMSELNDRQRAFVDAMLEFGGHIKKALVIAGYSTTGHHAQGTRLMHHPKVLAAIREEADRRFKAGAILSSSVIMEIASDPTHKDRFKAAVELANRAGLIVATQHNVKVEHTRDDAAMIARITELAGRLGLDAAQMLKAAGVKQLPSPLAQETVEQLEPIDVEPQSFNGLEDIL